MKQQQHDIEFMEKRFESIFKDMHRRAIAYFKW